MFIPKKTEILPVTQMIFFLFSNIKYLIAFLKNRLEFKYPYGVRKKKTHKVLVFVFVGYA